MRLIDEEDSFPVTSSRRTGRAWYSLPLASLQQQSRDRQAQCTQGKALDFNCSFLGRAVRDTQFHPVALRIQRVYTFRHLPGLDCKPSSQHQLENGRWFLHHLDSPTHRLVPFFLGKKERDETMGGRIQVVHEPPPVSPCQVQCC